MTTSVVRAFFFRDVFPLCRESKNFTVDAVANTPYTVLT